MRELHDSIEENQQCKQRESKKMDLVQMKHKNK